MELEDLTGRDLLVLSFWSSSLSDEFMDCYDQLRRTFNELKRLDPPSGLIPPFSKVYYGIGVSFDYVSHRNTCHVESEGRRNGRTDQQLHLHLFVGRVFPAARSQPQHRELRSPHLRGAERVQPSHLHSAHHGRLYQCSSVGVLSLFQTAYREFR